MPGYAPYGDEVVGVVGLAIVDDLAAPRRVLAARRREPASLAGGWELPGGKVEPGESWQGAAQREILEELGVRVRLGEFLPGPERGGLWRLGRRYVMGVWLAEVADGGTPRPLLDHDALRWLSAAELADVAWLPGDWPVVRAIRERLVPR